MGQVGGATFFPLHYFSTTSISQTIPNISPLQFYRQFQGGATNLDSLT